MIGRFRRIRCTNCPMPIEAVSPSPLTPKAIRLRLASMAPVATEGMRPCTALKLCERLMKYAGALEEQPIPLGFMTRSGDTPISYMASMMRSEIALCPQPAHSVVLPPLYSAIDSPIRLVFGLGVLVGVVAMLLALHHDDLVGYGPRIERQPMDMRNAMQPCDQFRPHIQLQQGEHLRIPILLDEVHALVLLYKIMHFARERISAQAQVIRFDVIFFAQLVAAFDDRPV